jgi:hypothetical protein
MRRVLAMLPLLTLLAAACQPGGALPATDTPISQEPAPATTASTEPAATGTEASPSETAVPPAEEPVEATSAPADPTPTLRQGLQATDPTTVELGGGAPTLVEFFAFW